MKNVLPLRALTLFVASAVLGCNPTGTCMKKSDGELGDQCIINQNKKACGTMGGEFVEETSAQAMLRCKGDGYEGVGQKPGAITEKLKKDEIVILYKK